MANGITGAGLTRDIQVSYDAPETNIIDEIFGTPKERIEQAEVRAKEKVVKDQLQERQRINNYRLYMTMEKRFDNLSEKRNVADMMGLNELVGAMDSKYNPNTVQDEEKILQDMRTSEDPEEIVKLHDSIYSNKDSYYYSKVDKVANDKLKTLTDFIPAAQKITYRNNVSTMSAYQSTNTALSAEIIKVENNALYKDDNGVFKRSLVPDESLKTYDSYKQELQENAASMVDLQVEIDTMDELINNPLKAAQFYYPIKPEEPSPLPPQKHPLVSSETEETRERLDKLDIADLEGITQEQLEFLASNDFNEEMDKLVGYMEESPPLKEWKYQESGEPTQDFLEWLATKELTLEEYNALGVANRPIMHSGYPAQDQLEEIFTILKEAGVDTSDSEVISLLESLQLGDLEKGEKLVLPDIEGETEYSRKKIEKKIKRLETHPKRLRGSAERVAKRLAQWEAEQEKPSKPEDRLADLLKTLSR